MVGAHSNFLEDGKGKGQKADDCYVVGACFMCHKWLDEGKASAAAKRECFHMGLKRQLRWWLDQGVIQIRGEKS